MDITQTRFEVSKATLQDISAQVMKVDQPLLAGQVLLAIDCFSFTANNVTYATLGETLRYWNFFPSGDVAKGIIPVWGFADVLASCCASVHVGERFYGYYPMASHLVVEPANISVHGFVDATHHRKSLPKIYNQYTNTETDPLYRADAEGLQMLMRPLFTTSFLLADFFDENDNFGAEQLVLTSASSKTAIGTALLLQAGKLVQEKRTHLVGLTSSANKAFVESLGCYDQVQSYQELAELNPKAASAVIDFAGNGQLLSDVAQHLADKLTYVSLVGVSHWDNRQGLEPLSIVPKPELFFAPTQAEKRLRQWSTAGFYQRLASAWSQFEIFSRAWLNIETYVGNKEIEAVYQRVLAGKQSPDKGYILAFSKDALS
ncbi:DUF2855 family protein [Simiduia curdlanivorans]|uniref:DUF2855 family protein n=1 Tax=Simiduia curdlanivorans TaxID=1492769 RepID=A0ABV8UZB4_9GAMM|nr:DUF2855 family protein [Simiduia curdlanivorans]MDN3640404.1 DUF2855 family protein [Simiduia curdlanivorans]